ncbi:MAG: hypothetical protein NTV03_01890 [Candidatus Nomurabacteria bacterium]|nr:hypothetical protein [Candidatus Nomurabacteria bacterium]
MSKDPCGACGTPKSKNHWDKDDCHHCYPENFYELKTIPAQIKNSGDIVDSPIFEGQGIEFLAELTEA